MGILVGYTGFVGSNIASNHNFDAIFNSKNISHSFGLKPDLCIYAGIPSEKFIAEKNPDADLGIIYNAINNIKRIQPRQLVLISTIDVYPRPFDVDENSEIEIVHTHPYGLHRFYLEQWVKDNLSNYLIIRLPALFGKNIKKNFIFDLINIVPSILSETKYLELSGISSLIKESYSFYKDGFYKCIVNSDQQTALKSKFQMLDFSALNFTDSRISYQFYNLSYLWSHINIALDRGLSLLNLAVEPVRVDELYWALKGEQFINEINEHIPNYDFKTRFAELFDGKNGYIFHKEKVVSDIYKFVIAEEMCNKT